MQDITTAADKEAAAAQARLADCVVEQAERLSKKINYATLLPLSIAALVCLILFGSMMLWAGLHIETGQVYNVLWILRMPSGILTGGLALAGSLFVGVLSASDFSVEGKRWKKLLLVALALMIAGGVLLALAL